MLPGECETTNIIHLLHQTNHGRQPLIFQSNQKNESAKASVGCPIRLFFIISQLPPDWWFGLVVWRFGGLPFPTRTRASNPNPNQSRLPTRGYLNLQFVATAANFALRRAAAPGCGSSPPWPARHGAGVGGWGRRTGARPKWRNQKPHDKLHVDLWIRCSYSIVTQGKECSAKESGPGGNRKQTHSEVSGRVPKVSGWFHKFCMAHHTLSEACKTELQNGSPKGSFRLLA